MALRWERGTLRSPGSFDVYLVSEDCTESQDCDLTPAMPGNPKHDA